MAKAVRSRAANWTSLLALALVLVGAITAVPGSWLTTAATFVSTWGFSGWALAAGLAVLMVIGVIRAVTRHPDIRREVRPLRWWWGVLIAGAILAATGLSLVWLLSVTEEPHQPQTEPTARVEAVRTALTLGAGLVGIAVLVLNSRRQWLAEHTQRHTEADSAEQRVTELYTAAAEQLGSDQAPVRMAGIYALERLAQSNPAHRRTVVNVLCAYLRMPFTPPDDDVHSETVEHKQQVQEAEVRLAVQRILHGHMVPAYSDEDDWYWREVDHLNLAGATLINFNFSRVDVKSATFAFCNFVGRTRFDSARILNAKFAQATFLDGANFRRAHIDTRFMGVEFLGFADFYEAQIDKRIADDATFKSGGRWMNGEKFNKHPFEGETAP